MSPGQGPLDAHEIQNDDRATFPPPSSSNNLHPPPPESAVLTPGAGYDDFPFPFPVIPGQPNVELIATPSNVVDPTNGFTGPPSLGAIDTPQPLSTISVQSPGFGPAMSGHRRPSIDIPGPGPDRPSPMTTSLDDSMADEFGLSAEVSGHGAVDFAKAKDDKAEPQPAWSELKTKAGKERKRLPLACIACRRKKIRCSGEKPACKHCLRARIPCVYKVNTRKPAPRTDYMAMLDKRLKRMEERIIKAIPKSEQEGRPRAATVPRAVVKPPIPGTVGANKAGTRKRLAPDDPGAELEAWSNSSPKRALLGSDPSSILQLQESEENKLLHEGSKALPSKEVQEELAEIFFENVYGQAYLLLHKPSYMRKLRNGTLPPVLILSVCAVSARFSQHAYFNPDQPQFSRGEEWASHARSICTSRYDWPNLTILTCLLILGLHEFGTCQGGRSWALGGLAIRMAFALQLHKDLEYDPIGRNGRAQLSFIDREIRRRMMWACFLMDRFNSSGTDRPMFIREETLRIPLPIKEQNFQLDLPAPTEMLDGRAVQSQTRGDGQVTATWENMGVAAYMIRAISLWGRIITYLYQDGKDLGSESIWKDDSEYSKLISGMEALQAALPDSFKHSPENLELHTADRTASQFLFLHIAIQQNILFLNRAAISITSPTARKEAPQNFFAEASAQMFAAANRISEYLREAETGGLIIAAPFAGYCTFCSTTVHILGMISGNQTLKRTAEANLASNVKFLTKMKKYWGMFHWMVEDVRTQYRKAFDAARSGQVEKKSAADPRIIQYGDWFNKYPHGLSDAEFMDPVNHKSKEKGADGVLEGKQELQSVEEFFSSLSSPQSTGSKDMPNQRGLGHAAKRRSISKKQGVATTKPGQQQQQRIDQTSATNVGGRALPGQISRQRQFSDALGNLSSGSGGLNPLTIAASQSPSFNTMSPLSPSTLTPFPQHSGDLSFFPPELLSMDLNQQGNGILQPLDRQLVFNGYSMDASNLATAPNMMEGIDWGSLALGIEGPGTGQNRRGSTEDILNDQLQMQDPMSALGFGVPEASSAWFMPFNMPPPDLTTQDIGLGVGNIDLFGRLVGSGESGMATPNQMSGVQHGA